MWTAASLYWVHWTPPTLCISLLDWRCYWQYRAWCIILVSYVWVCERVCMSVCVSECVWVSVCVSEWVGVCVCECACVCEWVCVSVCEWVCVCVCECVSVCEWHSECVWVSVCVWVSETDSIVFVTVLITMFVAVQATWFNCVGQPPDVIRETASVSNSPTNTLTTVGFRYTIHHIAIAESTPC